MYLHHSYSHLPYPAEEPHLVWTYSSWFFAVNMKSTASNLSRLSLSLTLSTRNSACRTRMGSSCACAVGPGMMLAVGELSHGNAKKKKKKPLSVCTMGVYKATSSDTYWPYSICHCSFHKRLLKLLLTQILVFYYSVLSIRVHFCSFYTIINSS